MLRRKLALYTLFYIAGIAAGYFIIEKSRTLEGAGFCAAVIAVICLTDPARPVRIVINRETRDETHLEGRHLDLRKAELKKQKIILIIVFFAGFLSFAFRSLSYNSAIAYVHDKNYIKGKVVSVTLKDDKLRYIVKNSESGPAKIWITLDAKAAERSTQSDTNPCGGLSIEEAYRYLGTEIEARGEYTEINSAENPGCFDYGLYMKSKGVSLGFKAYILEVTDTRVSLQTRVRYHLFSARESFLSRFDNYNQGFIRGVIFGDKSEIDEEIIEEFNSNSTGHILAVSGLHIGFLYALLRFLTARKRTFTVSVLIIAVILLYGEMTMWSAATVRACVVMTVSLLSTHLRRRSDLLTSISLAAFLILVYQPYQLFNSGFQLSFMALCGIAFLTGPISKVTGEGIAVMFAVQIGTMPVIAYSYCSINPLSMFINVPVILLSSVLVPLCILMLILEAAICRVPAAGIDLAELISYAVIKINHILSFDGSFSIRTAGPGAAAIIMIYILIFGLASEWTRVTLLRKAPKEVVKQGILLLLPLTMLFSCLYDTLSDDEIVFVAVGQGDCTHIRTGGHDVLIDGGGQASHNNTANSGHGNNGDDSESGQSEERNAQGYNVGENILMPYLMHGGADAVDIALVTHLHADHYKGIAELAEIFPIGAIGVPIDYRDSASTESFLAYAESQAAIGSEQTETFYIKPETKINLSEEVSIDVIWPVKISEKPLAADDPNEHNTVYMIHYGDIKVMVTGDLLEEDEREMLEYYSHTSEGLKTLKCDILKVAHHGSKSSSSEAFLDAASPKIAVIQCGRNNFYGHPHQQTLERLEERGITVLRTDLNGAVGIDIHGGRLSVDRFK